MKFKNRFAFLLCSAVLSTSFITAPSLRADDMYIWAEEVGGDVVFHHQGSLNLAGLNKTVTTALSGLMNPGNGSYRGAGGVSDVYENAVPDGMTRTFGMDNSSTASSTSGGFFVVDLQTNLGVSEAYTSGSPISGTMTFAGVTLDDLDVDTTPLTYPTTGGLNTIHMFTMPPAVVPVIDNSAVKTALLAKIKKAKKKVKAAKKKGQTAKAKKLNKKVKKLKAQLKALG